MTKDRNEAPRLVVMSQSKGLAAQVQRDSQAGQFRAVKDAKQVLGDQRRRVEVLPKNSVLKPA